MGWKDPDFSGIGSTEFFKFKDGNNHIRVVSSPAVIAKHYIDGSYMVCRGVDEGCDGCAQLNKASVRWLAWIIDREDALVKKVEFPYTVVKALNELAVSKQYGFDEVPAYDITVIRKGEKLDTEYTVLPDRKDTALSKFEAEDVALLEDPELIVERMKTPQEKTAKEPF